MTDFYRKFEDKYRGSAEVISGRLSFYEKFIESIVKINPEARALDIGCGRGEWLKKLKEYKVKHITGIDLNAHMLEAYSDSDVSTICGDALEYINKLEDESQDIITAFHFVEHIEFDDLTKLLQNIYRCLKPGGLVILETPNAENIIVGTNTFYLDPTHNKPLPALLLNFCIEYAGFETHNIVRLQENYKPNNEVGVFDVLSGSSQDYAIVARKMNKEVDDELNLLIKKNYGIDTLSLAKKYDFTMDNNLKEINERFEKQSSHISNSKNVLDDVLKKVNGITEEISELRAAYLQNNNYINGLLEKSESEKKVIMSELEDIKASRSWKLICIYRSFIIGLRLKGAVGRLYDIPMKFIHSSMAKKFYAKIYKVSPRFAYNLKSLAMRGVTFVAIKKQKKNSGTITNSDSFIPTQEKTFFSLVKKINNTSAESNSFDNYLHDIYNSEALSNLKKIYGDKTIDWLIIINAARRNPGVNVVDLLPHNDIDHEIGYALYMGLLGRVPGKKLEVDYPVKHLASVILNSPEYQNFSGNNLKNWLES